MEALDFLKYFLLMFAGGVVLAALGHIAGSMVAEAQAGRARIKRLRKALEHACLGTTEIDELIREVYDAKR